MNPILRIQIINEIKQDLPNLDESTVYEVIYALDKKGYLNSPSINNDSQGDKVISNKKNQNFNCPETFFMVSPLWQGKVNLIKKEDFVGYEDEYKKIRLHAPNLQLLAKRVQKYMKD